MKKIYILLLAFCAFGFSAHAQFPLDDIESYPLGPIHQGHWSSWDGIPSSDDLIVSDDEAFSGSQSILVPEGGTVDGILDLGNKISGNWQVDWEMYIPSGKSAYINMQNVLPAGTQFNFHMLWNEAGSSEGIATLYDANGANQGQGAALGSGPYPVDTWFHFTLMVDLDNLLMSLTMDGNPLVTNIPYPNNWPIPGLGGIDLYSNESNGESNRYYIDDVSYSDLLSVGSFDANAFTVFPNPVGDVMNIRSTSPVERVVVYDILGKLVLQETPGKISPSINTSNLPSGAYMVNVTIGNSTQTVKILK